MRGRGLGPGFVHVREHRQSALAGECGKALQ